MMNPATAPSRELSFRSPVFWIDGVDLHDSNEFQSGFTKAADRYGFPAGETNIAMYIHPHRIILPITDCVKWCHHYCHQFQHKMQPPQPVLHGVVHACRRRSSRASLLYGNKELFDLEELNISFSRMKV